MSDNDLAKLPGLLYCSSPFKVPHLFVDQVMLHELKLTVGEPITFTTAT